MVQPRQPNVAATRHMTMDTNQDRLYLELAAAQSDDERAKAWHAFVRSGATDGDVQHFRQLCARSDPAAVIARLNEDASARAKQAVSALGLEPPEGPASPR